jgi:hypothetical protein
MEGRGTSIRSAFERDETIDVNATRRMPWETQEHTGSGTKTRYENAIKENAGAHGLGNENAV